MPGLTGFWRPIRLVAVPLLLASCLAGCGLGLSLPFGGGGGDPLESGQPSLDLSRKALASGAPQLALNASSSVLAREPDNKAAHLAQADALVALGRMDEAAASYRAALGADPESVDARIGLGRIALGSDPAAAEQLFLEAVKREPRNAVALNDLGIARDLLGRHAEAQAAYRLAVGAAPGSHAAEVNLALSLALSGHAAEGAQLLRPLIANPDASPRAKQDMAAVAALAEDRSTAEALLKADLNPQQVRDALTAYELLRATPPRPN